VLDIFITNAVVTTEAYALLSEETIPDVWKKILPSPEIIAAELNEYDKQFVCEVAFQYLNLRSAAKWIKIKHKQRPLSDVLARWHRNLEEHDPLPDEVIFLCEKYRIFDKEPCAQKCEEYKKLKNKHQNREAV
jgi:hypothetical protein